MSLLRSFIIRGPDQAKQLHTFLKQNASAMADAGKPLEVTVREWKPRATDEQRALIWVINEQIAQQAWVGGRQYDAETWHEQAKRQFLPEKSENGVAKWKFLSDGTRYLHMSTEHLNRSEKSVYIDQLMAWAATDLGVQVRVLEPA